MVVLGRIRPASYSQFVKHFFFSFLVCMVGRAKSPTNVLARTEVDTLASFAQWGITCICGNMHISLLSLAGRNDRQYLLVDARDYGSVGRLAHHGPLSAKR